MRRPSKHASVYGDAINKLGNQLGDGPAFEAASDWAIDFCKKVQQKDWPRRGELATWDSGSRAATQLAIYLKNSDDLVVTRRLFAAAEKSGVALKPDPPVRWGLEAAAKALRKFVLVLSKQDERGLQQRRRTRPSRYVFDEATWFVCGPLVLPRDGKRNIVMPRRPLALAIGLTHGFRSITAARHPKEEIYPLNHTYAPIKRKGGRPCFEAAAEFANATFPEDRATSADAVKKYISRHSLRFRWFGDKQRGQ